MKTCFMFPGLNGLTRNEDRQKILKNETVKKKLLELAGILKDKNGIDWDPQSFLGQESSSIYKVDNIPVTAASIVTIQVALAEELLKRGTHTDWLVGCSLGDNARSVIAGVLSFEDCISQGVKLMRQVHGVDKVGLNVGVSTGSVLPFTAEDITAMEEDGVDVSRLTPRFLNVGGRFSDIDKVKLRAEQKGWKVMPIIDYPAHSACLKPFIDEIEHEYQKLQFNLPQKRLFSSFSGLELTDVGTIRQEMLSALYRPINWDLTIRNLINEHDVSTFINIGPCTSLSKMMRDIDSNVKVIEALELI